jgi:protein TonB
MYYLGNNSGLNDRLVFALFLAAALHALLILGISFDLGERDQRATQLDVTLATRSADRAPEDAEFTAQANQMGSGNIDELTRLTSIEQSQLNDDQLRTLASRRPPVEAQQASNAPVLNTRRTADIRTQADAKRNQPEPDPLTGINPELEKLSQDIASLQARLDRQNTDLSRMPRVRRLTAASAREAIDAAYLNHWRSRVEAIGNQYYPEASRRYGIYGSLRMLVVVDRDGNLEDIEILSSSGHAVLDQAAIKIVRLAAPFAAFPDALRATTDKLEIIRTWQFQENGLSSE